MADLPSEKRYVETAFGPTEAEATALAFERIARTRRSVRVFTPEPLPEAVLRRCIDLAMTAPSSSNLQPWEFHWVRTPALKQELIAACMGQAAAATAAELVVCVARTRTWDRNRKRMLQFLKQFAAEGWRVPPSVYTYYEKETLLMYSHGWLGLQGLLKRVAVWFLGLTRPVMRGPFSQNDMRMWAIKSTALACQNLMLALRAEGYDSCPMEGADAVRVAKLLHLPADAEVVMTLGCGKRSDKGIYAPASRFEREWFVFEH